MWTYHRRPLSSNLLCLTSDPTKVGSVQGSLTCRWRLLEIDTLLGESTCAVVTSHLNVLNEIKYENIFYYIKQLHLNVRWWVTMWQPQWNDHELFMNGSWTVHVQFMNTYSWTVHELSMNMKWPSSWSWWGSWTWSS